MLQFRARLATLRSRRDEGQGLAPDPPENRLGGQRRRGPARPVGVGWGRGAARSAGVSWRRDGPGGGRANAPAWAGWGRRTGLGRVGQGSGGRGGAG